jgi:hypothetical protein
MTLSLHIVRRQKRGGNTKSTQKWNAAHCPIAELNEFWKISPKCAKFMPIRDGRKHFDDDIDEENEPHYSRAHR